MAFRVELLPSAARAYRSLPPAIRPRIRAAIDRLAKDSRPPGARRLKGTPAYWRARVGDYRILYEIRDVELLILVIAIGHRREVYR